ncbi:YhbY family RNA-binding protein [Zhongshania borealis]|jgi:RNA-binding protein
MPKFSASDKKHLRSIGHKLSPVVMIADKGLSESVALELDRALDDHELIKVKVNIAEPTERRALIEQLCEAHKALLIQAIGKIALIYRPAKKPNPKLSNLLRA